MSADTAAQLRSATAAFDALFANRIGPAKAAFAADSSPFHLLGQGVCAFLEAALGMESARMTEASRCLALAEAGAKKRVKEGVHWEVLHADAVVLLGLTNALSESYMGYVQCIYALNSAHSKFNRLFKLVFPAGLDGSPVPSSSLTVTSSAIFGNSSAASSTSSFFKWGSGSRATSPLPATPKEPEPQDPAITDLITAGTAFGHGLFSLVFSLLPSKARMLVGALGFRSDRPAALAALVKAAECVDGALVVDGQEGGGRGDVHGVFAALVLMTYWGAVLLVGGWCASEGAIVKEYAKLVQRVSARYPTGALWILNRAKILRMTHDANGAIEVLQDGLKEDEKEGQAEGTVDGVAFREADTLLLFELAWTLLAQRRYPEAGGLFMRITELNSWSHATYYFLAAGCYFSAGDKARTQTLLDAIPGLMEKRKGPGGKELPTEAFCKKKLAFYKTKQRALGGDEAKYVDVIRISPAEEMAIFWNTHARIDATIARAHIDELSALTPAVGITSPYITPSPSSQPTPASSTPSLAPSKNGNASVDLTTPDELAIRALLLGITHRALGPPAYPAARAFLDDAVRTGAKCVAGGATWVVGVAYFETAVLELKVADAVSAAAAASDGEDQTGAKVNGQAKENEKNDKELWAAAITRASVLLDRSAGGGDVDLSSRLESRVGMLREELKTKRAMVGLAV